MTGVRVTSLGLFILDTFEWRTASGDLISTKETAVGGGGTYAILGSRVFLPAREVGLLVDKGNDFPAEVEDELKAFGKEMWHYRPQPRPTTRALNLYTGEHRDFKYLNTRTRLEPVDIPPSLRSASYVHCVCSPTRALVIHSQFTPTWSPDLIYEPIPDRCIPSELPSLRKLFALLGPKSVFSPNHEEAWAFFGVDPRECASREKNGIEDVAQKFFAEGADTIIVIRSGAMGAYVKRRGEEGVWVEAYHRTTDKVVDVTGAGNSFLGGLMAGLALDGNDLVTSTQMGAVSSSFVIEQFGLAKLTLQEGEEKWNGCSAQERLQEMKSRHGV